MDNKPQPVVEKAQPDVQKAQPDVEKVQPDVQKAQPDVEKAQPDVQKAQPDVEKPQPVVQKVQPDVEKPQADVQKVEPEDQTPNTAILSGKGMRRRVKAGVPKGTVSFGGQSELILVIRGIVERIVLPEDLSVVLGRSDARLRYHADVDLTPYGALDRGVSREHARVYAEAGNLYIVDIASTNGTFVSGTRLAPHTPTVLRKGDEVLLGRLPIQILFR